MLPKHEIPDDLDYLAELGFEALPTTDPEVDALRRDVAVLNGGNGISTYLILAAFVCVNVFFARYNREVVYPTYADKPDLQVVRESADSLPETLLDEVLVLPERRPAKPIKNTGLETTDTLATHDTVNVITLIPKVGTESLPLSNQHPRLKPLLNSEISFIHDLKVSDYRRLYFKRSINNDLPGVPAAFAQKQTESGRRLKQNAEIYLHTEFREALLLFKKQRWNECAYKLQQIAYYNKEDVNCSFYLGMCLYERKNYVMAITHFETCLQSSNNAFAEEAKFYKALCLHESGNSEAANALFVQIKEAGGFYSGRAETYLR